jgi:uncharacterized protein (DUF58 family)
LAGSSVFRFSEPGQPDNWITRQPANIPIMVTPFDEEFLRRLETLRLAFARRAAADREGDRTRRRPGGSPEFDSHRTYSPGDDPMRIDWNVYARLGDLFLKQFEKPSAEALLILLDTSASMAPKLDQARRIAAAMVFVASAAYARVELSGGGARVTPASVREALGFLEGLSAAGSDEPRAPDHRCAVAVLSDLWIDEAAFLRRAAEFHARGGELALVHVLAPEEIEPTLDGALMLRDAETGRRRKLFVGEPERAEYRRRLQETCARWRREAARLAAPYARVRTDEPIDAILLERLRAAGVLE